MKAQKVLKSKTNLNKKKIIQPCRMIKIPYNKKIKIPYNKMIKIPFNKMIKIQFNKIIKIQRNKSMKNKMQISKMMNKFR